MTPEGRMDPKQEKAICGLCGEPMPPGEEMFRYHGYSGPCPKPPLPVEALEPLAVTHARKQGAADGFQHGWHAALARIRSGDTPEELAALVPEPPHA